MNLNIKEIFYSLQGEGANTGIRAIFIRLAGCNLSCSYCDTDWKQGRILMAKNYLAFQFENM